LITLTYYVSPPQRGKERLMFMQKLSFVFAFVLAFFTGCSTAGDEVDAGCTSCAPAAAEAPAAEAAPEAPAPAAEAAVESVAPAEAAAVSEAPAAEAAPTVSVEAH